MRPDSTPRVLPRRGPWKSLPWALGLTLVMAGCGGGDDEAVTSVEEGFEGLSRDEIQQQAEAMTLEQAESLGIVDTTIRIQPPMDPDSVIPSGGVAPVSPADTAS